MDLKSISLPGLTLILARNVNANVVDKVADNRKIAERQAIDAEYVRLTETSRHTYNVVNPATKSDESFEGYTYNSRLEMLKPGTLSTRDTDEDQLGHDLDIWA